MRGVAKMSGETREGGDARPGRLLGVGHHRRGDGRFGFGDRVRVKVGPEVAREREGRQVEAVVAGALQLRRAPLAPHRSGRSRSTHTGA